MAIWLLRRRVTVWEWSLAVRNLSLGRRRKNGLQDLGGYEMQKRVTCGMRGGQVARPRGDYKVCTLYKYFLFLLFIFCSLASRVGALCRGGMDEWFLWELWEANGVVKCDAWAYEKKDTGHLFVMALLFLYQNTYLSYYNAAASEG